MCEVASLPSHKMQLVHRPQWKVASEQNLVEKQQKTAVA